MFPLAARVASPNGIVTSIGTCWSIACSKSPVHKKNVQFKKKGHMGINYVFFIYVGINYG